MYSTLFTLILFQKVISKNWTPKSLFAEVKPFEILVDPEYLNDKNNLVEVLNKKFLSTNKVYTKVTLKIFLVSKLNIYYKDKQKLFLHEMMLLNNYKSSYLSIVLIVDEAEVFILPSEKLNKLLSENYLNLIKEKAESFLSTGNREISICILKIFEALDSHLGKYKIHNREKKKPLDKDSAEIKSNAINISEIVQVVISILTLLLIFISYRRKIQSNKMKAKNFGNIIIDKTCAFCLEEIKVIEDKKNFLLYEEICICEYNKSEYVGILKCGHIYHALCIEQWEKECEKKQEFDLICPQCKRSDKNGQISNSNTSLNDDSFQSE